MREAVLQACHSMHVTNCKTPIYSGLDNTKPHRWYLFTWEQVHHGHLNLLTSALKGARNAQWRKADMYKHRKLGQGTSQWTAPAGHDHRHWEDHLWIPEPVNLLNL